MAGNVARQAENGLTPDEVASEVAADLPDREAMSLVPPDLLGQGTVLPDTSILTDILAVPEMPPEAQSVDLNAVLQGTLGPDGSPLDGLPPELVPDTQIVSEDQTIGG